MESTGTRIDRLRIETTISAFCQGKDAHSWFYVAACGETQHHPKHWFPFHRLGTQDLHLDWNYDANLPRHGA